MRNTTRIVADDVFERSKRCILVTGSSKRLGKSIALSLAHEGWSVLLHYRESYQEAVLVQEECYRIAQQQKSTQTFQLIQGDFSTLQTLQVFLDAIRFFPLYGVVNNVGVFYRGKASEFCQKTSEELFRINFFAPYYITQSLLPMLQNQGDGIIINIGSCGLQRFSADIYAPIYHASKHALLYLTKSLAKELAPFHIAVNMISPGKLDISVDKEDSSHVIPYGRLGTVDEVADTVCFCVDEKNRYITGQNIEVSGGFCL